MTVSSAVDVGALVHELSEAIANRTAIGPLTAHTPMTNEDGYAVQAAHVAQKVAAGDKVIGAKLGLTSKAKQKTMKVDEPCYGVLMASGLLPAEEPLRLNTLIHPRVEPEIVFRIGERLAGPGITSAAVLDATEAIGCGMEIIDSRFADFKFTLPDVVADNTSAARFILGPRWVDPKDIPDLSLVGVVLEADGQPVTTAAGAAILGHPAEAVALLANWLGARGKAIEAGWIVFSGGMTDAVPLTPGRHVNATFGRLGRITIRAVEE